MNDDMSSRPAFAVVKISIFWPSGIAAVTARAKAVSAEQAPGVHPVADQSCVPDGSAVGPPAGEQEVKASLS
jgi:hypothetical protein